MVSTFSSFFRATVQRSPRRLTKQVLLGVLVGVVLSVGWVLFPQWIMPAVMLYLLAVQAVVMSDNDVFFSFADLRKLGFREPSASFHAAYLGHYLGRDMYVATILAWLIPLASTVVVGEPDRAFVYAALILASLFLIPEHVYFADRVNMRTRMLYLMVCAAAPLGLVAASVFGWAYPRDEYVVALALVGLALAQFAVLRGVARRGGAGQVSAESGGWLRWLRPVAPHLFKDVILLQGAILQSLVGGAALFALLAIGTPKEFLSPLVLLAFGHDNGFLARRSGSYRIIADDPLFAEDRLLKDRVLLRRYKLRSILMDVPLKAILVVGILLVLGTASVEQVVLALAVVLVNAVVDAPLLFADSRLARWLRAAVKYLVIAAFALTVSFRVPIWAVVICLSSVALIYGVQWISVYGGIPKRPTSVPASAAIEERAGVPAAP